jgi:uncharacterized protein
MVDEKGPHYFVAFHSPGPKWVEGTPYNEQPEFTKHVEYSGPFMAQPRGLAGELANGGMAILKAADLEEATELGTDDPTVQSGMLKVEMKTFWVPFHD